MTVLLILFGLSCSGKNFVGEILAREFNYYHWDADLDMPESMREQILKKEFFTQDMRDHFTKIIINKIAELKNYHSNLVVTQALYKEKNREQIALAYPEAKFIQIKATQENIMRRLQQRNDWIDQMYAKKISLNFEPPQQIDAVILNNSDAAAVILQLAKILD